VLGHLLQRRRGRAQTRDEPRQPIEVAWGEHVELAVRKRQAPDLESFGAHGNQKIEWQSLAGDLSEACTLIGSFRPDHDNGFELAQARQAVGARRVWLAVK
jgi:hypothetical protein